MYSDKIKRGNMSGKRNVLKLYFSSSSVTEIAAYYVYYSQLFLQIKYHILYLQIC